MKQPKKPMIDNSQNNIPQQKPSSVASKAKKTESSNPKVQAIDGQSGNGLADSPSTTQTKKSEPEKESSSKGKKLKSEMPVPKLGKSKDRVDQALKRLGVKREKLALIPPLSAMIKQDAKEAGGQKAVLEALRFSPENPEISSFLEAYDKIPGGDRERLPWEAIAVHAGINVTHLLGAIHIAVQRYSASRVKFITVMGHPLIAAARIKFGQLPSGEKDRTAIDTMTGALPSPKGPTFIGKAVFGGSIPSSKDDEEEEDGDTIQGEFFTPDHDLDGLFPPSNSMQEKVTKFRQKLLE